MSDCANYKPPSTGPFAGIACVAVTLDPGNVNGNPCYLHGPGYEVGASVGLASAALVSAGAGDSGGTSSSSTMSSSASISSTSSSSSTGAAAAPTSSSSSSSSTSSSSSSTAAAAPTSGGGTSSYQAGGSSLQPCDVASNNGTTYTNANGKQYEILCNIGKSPPTAQKRDLPDS